MAVAKNVRGENSENRKKNNLLLPIVGIGASAGGLNALKQFFSNIPEDSGFAWVVIVHLSPEHKSMLAELLQPHIKMPVQQVTETLELKPNNVYVIPPNSNLNSIDTHLRLSDLEEKRTMRAPIDHFFRTLAKTHNGRAVGVILTGTGSDGTLGIKEIKEKGGLTIAQDPFEAEYDGMPQSAISTGLVDMILPLKDIPENIISYFATRPKIRFLQKGKEASEETKQALNKIIVLVRTRTRRDFSRYKISTLLRRVERRMQINQIEDLKRYIDFLRKNSEEVRTLSDDFLINVTSFFRDPKVFDYIGSKILPQIFKIKKQDEPLRVWSVGCATGEEAYSIAILLREVLDRLQIAGPVQIFASDLHDNSLKKARDGFFPGDIKTDVTPGRLQQFFVKDAGGYRIRKDLREQVVFTPHNLLADPPFSRIDLILCRNLLIYLRREVQRDVFDLFHYSLNPGGFLVLGPSETLEDSELFGTEHKEFSIFKKKNVNVPEPRLPVFPSTQKTEHKFPSHQHTEENISFGAIHQKAVEHYGPPSILVSPDYQLLHVSQTAGRYLTIPGGEPSRDIFKLVRSELQLELRTTIHTTKEEKRLVRSKPVDMKIDGENRQVFVSARLIQESAAENSFLLVFEEYDEPVEPALDKEKIKDGDAHFARQVEILEKELQEKRQQLQAIVEEYETSREEMKASNEELQSSNEELRSAMEELETSKEELQSVNEELTTVNQENRHKVEELSQLSDDLQNLLSATDIATLFLDRELRILRYTPQLGELFNVRPADKGRKVSDITHKLLYHEMETDAKMVLKNLQPVQREISDDHGNTFLTHLLPYRKGEDKIGGVVITFIDITERKENEKQLAKNEEKYRAIANTMFNILYRMSPDWSEMAELQGKGFLTDITEPDKYWRKKYIPENWLPEVNKVIQKAIDNKEMFVMEHQVFRADGSTGWASSRAIPMLDSDGNITEWIGAAIDITERKESEKHLEEEKAYAESIIETLHEPLLVLNPDLTVKTVNQAFYDHFRVNPKETIGQMIYKLGNNQWDIPALRKLLEDVLPDSNVFNDFEVTHNFETIGEKTMLVNARRLDHVQLILLGIRDITERKQAEKQIGENEERLRLTFDAMDIGSWVREYGEEDLFMDEKNARLFGFEGGAQNVKMERIYERMHPEDRDRVQQAAKKAWEQNSGYSQEFRVLVNGEEHWLAGRGKVVQDGTRKMIGINYNITERKNTERELSASRSQYKSLFESIDEGFCILEMIFDKNEKPVDYRFIEVNPAFEKQTGLKNAAGKTMRELEPNHEQHWFDVYGRIAKTGKPERFQQKAYYLSDRTFDLYAFRTGQPWENKVAVLFEDITQHLKDKQELEAAREAAEKAAKIKEEFLAHMSHEIRTPLNAIMGLSYLLLEQPHEEHQEINLTTLKTAAENLHQLINDILDYSKLKSGKWKLNKEKVNLRECINELMIMHRPFTGEKGIKLEADVAANIPEQVVIDETKLMQILNNLVSNAIKFTANGGVKVEVKLNRRKNQNLWLEFAVSDTGIGIKKSQLKKIFDEFSQVDPTTVKQFKGTGLGLAIVKMYLHIMDSEIHVESTPGKGSRFWFELPVKAVKTDGDNQQATEEKNSSGNMKNARVLIVEDDEFSRMMLDEMLSMWGIAHDEVVNGREAVEMAGKNHYQLILIDVHMPVMDGFEATRRIREMEAYKETPIYAITADASDAVTREVNNNLFTGKLLKPFDPDQLHTVIKDILAGEYVGQ